MSNREEFEKWLSKEDQQDFIPEVYYDQLYKYKGWVAACDFKDKEIARLRAELSELKKLGLQSPVLVTDEFLGDGKFICTALTAVNIGEELYARQIPTIPADSFASASSDWFDSQMKKARNAAIEEAALEAYEWCMAYVIEDCAPRSMQDVIRAMKETK